MPKVRPMRQGSRSSPRFHGMTNTPCNSAANSLDMCASLDLDHVLADQEVLTPQKVADHLSKTLEGREEGLIQGMPDAVMMEMFGYLSFKDLCHAACVCRRWNHIARKKPLWRHVNLLPYKITLPNLRKLVFSYFTNSLRSLSLRGFLHSVKKTECLSDSLLQEIGRRCPKLQELCIWYADLSKVSSSNLPRSLVTLNLISCQYPLNWLAGAGKDSRLDSLLHLDLTGSNGFRHHDLEFLVPKPASQLVSLKLCGCYRQGDHGASSIAAKFPNVKELDISRMTMTNAGLQKIACSLKRLKTFRMSHCVTVDRENSPIFDLHHLSPLKELEELDVCGFEGDVSGREGEQFNANVLVSLVNSLPRLKVLKVSKDRTVTQNHIARMRNACTLPSVEGDPDNMLRIGFYPTDQIKKLQMQQSAQ